MPLQPQDHVQKSGVLGAPIGYVWNSQLASELYAEKDQNPQLYDAIDQATLKAKMSLGVAIAEWIVWRFTGHADLADATLRIEAAWAGAIEPIYARDLSCEMTHDDDQFPVEGALELALCVLGETSDRYRDGSLYLAEPVVTLATLAAYLVPDKQVFLDWLSPAVARLVQAFPQTKDFDRVSRAYDTSLENPVPRELFDPSFAYDNAAATVAIRRFLQSLDPRCNAYLRSADEMRADGFTGTPYSL
jgi:hypothetical protein